MLTIYVSDTDVLVKKYPEFILYPSAWFDLNYTEEWLQDEFSRRCISEIDKIPLGESTLRSLLEENMKPEDLCNGTKNLINCKFLDKMGNLLKMGPNCYHLLMDLADEKELMMGLGNSIIFKDTDLKGRLVYFPLVDFYAKTSYEFNQALVMHSARGYY